MKFGVASLFAFRPHVEHLAYLADLLRAAGHDISGLVCDSAVDACYSRELRGHSRLRQCPACIFGGLRSYAIPSVRSIDRRLREPLDPAHLRALTQSSVATVLRTEAASDLEAPEFAKVQRRLEKPVEVVYANAKRWIAERNLDAVLLFNGRMDLTAAVRAACREMRCPVVTVERSWFGHGLQLVPNESSIALGELGRLNEQFRDRPLTAEQAAYAGRRAADRFQQRNSLEWRLYNAGAVATAWPTDVGKGPRALILPGSRNEYEGHPDFAVHWPDSTIAMDTVMQYLALDGRNCVMRCHPNWAERIGKHSGRRSEQHWADWAERRGIRVIRSADRANTYGLIDAADFVLVNGSSAGVDAALAGRRVVCVGHSSYERAGFAAHLYGPEDLPQLEGSEPHDPERTARLALRYVYTHGRRFAQYWEFVRALTTFRYEYYEGADPERVVRLCRSGRSEADDARYATTTADEDAVVEKMLAGRWDELGKWQEPRLEHGRLRIQRRLGLRWIDGARAAFAPGDR